MPDQLSEQIERGGYPAPSPRCLQEGRANSRSAGSGNRLSLRQACPSTQSKMVAVNDPHLAGAGTPTLRGFRSLKLRNPNLLSAEDPGIERPCARSNEGQAHPQYCHQDLYARVRRTRNKRPHLEDGAHTSCNRCPQAKEKKDAGDDACRSQQLHFKSRRYSELDDRILNQDTANHEPLQEQSQAGEPVGESGKEPLHDYP
jgi:hypothetical protein